MTLAQMKQVLQNLPPVVRKVKEVLEVLRVQVLALVGSVGGYSVTTTFVDGTDGTGTVQFVFTDGNGAALTAPITGSFYFSDVATGLTTDAVGTSVAVLTNGSIDLLGVALTQYAFTTSAAGLLGLTIGNGAADSIWVVFPQPDGTLLISDEMAITGP